MSRLSIRGKLTAAFAGSLALVLVLAGSFIYLRLSSELKTALGDSLEVRSNDLTNTITAAGPSAADLEGAGFGERGEGFVQVLSASGRVLDSTPGVSSPLIDPGTGARALGEQFFIDDLKVPNIDSGTQTLVRDVQLDDSHEVVTVVGAATDDRVEALDGLLRAFAIGGPAALLLASGLGYLLAAAALRPVEAMRRRAEEITLHTDGERLPLPDSRDEIRSLGETLNAMLARLEDSLQRERRFVADASHELRTPLAVMKTELELALRGRRGEDELRESVQSAAEETDRLARLADDLLIIARSDEGLLPVNREQVPVGELLGTVRDRFEARARRAGRPLEVEVDGQARANLDRLRIEQAAGNLVDNALRHGRGPIRISGEIDGARVLIAVTDHGDGFPPEFVSQAFGRFTRAEGSREREGSGLGLAIVEAVARAHGGEARIGQAGGATTVTIELVRGEPG